MNLNLLFDGGKLSLIDFPFLNNFTTLSVVDYSQADISIFY